jgi:D-alanyl-lipoteichoic acid acyltransferase DltB (MBOAT superfamily)
VLVLGIVLNLLLLGYFKYTNFGLSVLSGILHRDFFAINVVLPLAISFFTFTQLSYLIDVHRDHRVHYGIVDYALFVAFFPHLIAGPILRHWEVIPQFSEKGPRTSLDDVSVGSALFLFGLVKKIFLADSVAVYANLAYQAAGQKPETLTTLDAWLGTIAFALQIYFDFSAYSDMAIGLARIFGIRFPSNFDSPYQGGSIIVFWERWHMTLTRFLREYVYFSLGGNRRGALRQALNIMGTMLLSGLWHGAGWTFIIWGGVHGGYLVIAHQWRLVTKRMRWKVERLVYRITAHVITFVAVLFAWVLFRAPSLQVARTMFASMTGRHGVTLSNQIVLYRFWTKLFAGLQVHRVSGSAIPIDQVSQAICLCLSLLVLCWFMPNSQQLLARYHPLLTPVSRPTFLTLRIDWKMGLGLGVLGFLMVRAFYIEPPNPFIYFNF